MGATIAFWIGALLGTFILHKFILWLMRLVGLRLPGDGILACILTLGVSTFAGGYGMADGGSVQFELAFLTYLWPCTAWAMYHAGALRAVSKRGPPTTA